MGHDCSDSLYAPLWLIAIGSSCRRVSMATSASKARGAPWEESNILAAEIKHQSTAMFNGWVFIMIYHTCKVVPHSWLSWIVI